LTDDDAVSGQRAARLKLEGPPSAPFGNLMRTVDARQYRGHSVRLAAKIRLAAEAPQGGRAMMWLRVDRPNGQIGFFDNMAGRPIQSQTWVDAVIEGDVDEDAESLALGIMSVGASTVLVDDVRLERLRPTTVQPAAPPRTLTPREVENLTAAARLLAYVRFFHPSDEALAVKAWDHFAVQLVEKAEPAQDAADLAQRLQKALAPLAPTIAIWPDGIDEAPPEPAAPADADSLRYWSHQGAGTVARPPSVYSSQTLTVRLDGWTPAGTALQRLAAVAPSATATGKPPATPFLVKPLGGGVSCRLPVMVYVADGASLPRSGAENPWASVEPEPKLTASNRATRLAAVATLWGVMQHFYPYFDVVQTDWDAALPVALQSAAADNDAREFLDTLRALVAKLHDGHGNVFHPGLLPRTWLPIALGWTGELLVVTGRDASAPSEIAVGDAIVTIGGQTLQELDRELSPRTSAATDSWRRWQLASLLQTDRDGDASTSLRLRKPDGSEYDVTVASVGPKAIPQPQLQPPPNGAELAPGIVYFDLNGAEGPALAAAFDKLAAAKGIVFDLRGYPGQAAVELLTHLIDKPVTSAHWNIPVVTLPDRESWAWNSSHWELSPVEPRFAAQVAFLTDGRAISYAESIMGIVEHYRLGEIVGGATAGTNGNVNPIELPGGYTVMWTGMQVLKHDGTPHHGVGVKPTIPVEPTAAGVAAGRDEVLEAAVEAIERKLTGQ
jgi:hypothetical protein